MKLIRFCRFFFLSLLVILVNFFHLSLILADINTKNNNSQNSSKTTLVTSQQSSEKPSSQFKYTKEFAKEIIQKAEALRSEPQAKTQVVLTTVEGDVKTVYDLMILKSTEKRAYVEFLSPPEERGRKMLALKRQYWSTFADSKKVIPISRKEMIGNSAFVMADLFQIDTDKEYDPSVVGEETCKVSDKAVGCLKLNLLQKTNEAPYYRIEYFVDSKTHYPLYAKFYGISNKLLKTMYVEKSANLAGKYRPVRLKMVDYIIKNKFSIWETKTLIPMQIPDNIFTKDYLRNE